MDRFWAKVDKDGPMPDPATGLTTCCWEFTGSRRSGSGYGQFLHQGKPVGAHRMAWLLDGRKLPESPLSLDHICWNKACVRLDHLRVATKREQQINTGLRKDNKSGVRGVSWDKRRGKWRVTSWCESKQYYGGSFDDHDEAVAAALALQERLNGS